jgi:hypothetical protein
MLSNDGAVYISSPLKPLCPNVSQTMLYVTLLYGHGLSVLECPAIIQIRRNPDIPQRNGIQGAP